MGLYKTLSEDRSVPWLKTGLKTVTSVIYTEKMDVPDDGGDWYYVINGKKEYLRDIGGWNVNGNQINYTIPLEYLNFTPVTAEIAGTCPGSGDLPDGEWDIINDEYGEVVRVNLNKIKDCSKVPGIKMCWEVTGPNGEASAAQGVRSVIKDVALINK